MTVFDTVTATLTPNVSSYLRGKGKAWRAAFITSLQTVAGVEYTVYKKKGSWQIKGNWERIKHAHRILTKVTTADDWSGHLAREEAAAAQRAAAAAGPGPGTAARRRRTTRATRGTPAPGSPRRESSDSPSGEHHSDQEQISTEMTPDPVSHDIDDRDIPVEFNIAPELVQACQTNTEVSLTILDTTGSGSSSKEGYGPMKLSDFDKLSVPHPKDNETYLTKSKQAVPVRSSSNPQSEVNRSLVKSTPVRKSLGNRRKRGRPRKIKIVDSAEEVSAGSPADMGNETSLVNQELSNVPMFTDSDLEKEAEDVSDDPDFSIDKMVKDGKADLKSQTSAKSYSCNDCSFTCRSRNGVLEHKKRQHVEKTLKCPICDKMYGVKRDLRKHIRRHTSQFKCQECGKAYKEERNYKNHLKTHELDYVPPQFSCEQCAKSFTTKYVLQTHVDQVHMGNVPEWLCTTCGKKFKQKHSLTEHNLIHTGERPFACKICLKTFRHKGSCVNHELLHSNVRLYTCEICGKDFKHRNSLRIHAAVHNTMRNYECGICGKKFTQKQALIRHSRIHSGEKPFMCDLCGDRFNDNSILRRHMQGIHKTELRSGKQHYVLPADHYQIKAEEEKCEDSNVNPTQEEEVEESQGPDPVMREQGDGSVQEQPPTFTNTTNAALHLPLPLEDFRFGHVASSLPSPYTLHVDTGYPGYAHSNSVSISRPETYPNTHTVNISSSGDIMPISDTGQFGDRMDSVKVTLAEPSHVTSVINTSADTQSQYAGSVQPSLEKPHLYQRLF